MPDAAGRPLDVYEAAVVRFTSSGLDQVFTGGLVVGEEVPGTDFPYALLDPGGEPVVAVTNRTRYRRPLLQLSVYARTFGQAKDGVRQVEAAFDAGPVTLAPPLAALALVVGGVRFQEEQSFWRAMMDVEVLQAQPGPVR